MVNATNGMTRALRPGHRILEHFKKPRLWGIFISNNGL